MESDKVTASKLSIENLSDDVLLELFKYLNKGAIKESSRVCQRWHDLILGSKVLTERLTLFFETDNYLYPLDVYQEIFSDLISKSNEFPYRNFKIVIREPQSMEIWTEIQDKFLQAIKNPLKLELVLVPKLVKLNVLQASASTLTHLCLKYGSDRDLTFDLPFEFPNLVSLELENHLIPRSLEAPKLKELSYSGPQEYLEDNLVIFSEFLCQFDGLRKLETASVPIIDGKAVKFQLLELRISSRELLLEPLKAFLMTQQKSLKTFKLFGSGLDDCRDLLNFLTLHTKLEELSIRSNFDENYQPEEVEELNFSVKKLYLHINSDRREITSDFLIPIYQKFRGVEELDIQSMTRLERIFEEVDMSNLKELYLNFKDGNSFDSFKFAQFKLEKLTKLKILSIDNKKEATNLVKVTSFCPNLKTLSIYSLEHNYHKKDKFSKSHFQILFKFSPNLEDFVINQCPFLLSSFMFHIMTVKSNLRRLKVGIFDVDQIPVMQKKMGNAKFLCDFHYYDVVGMKTVEWNRNEYKSW